MQTSQTSRPSHAYHEGDRRDLLDWVGGRHASVLEVGCGRGGNAQWYRAHGARRIVGVELDNGSADVARASFDEVIPTSIESALDSLAGPFDLIVCADVLEHLVDPWRVARGLVELATDETRLAISIPNIRHYRALARIALGAGFRYEPEGVFDRTHLRFFTRANIVSMLVESGWTVERIETSPGRQLRYLRRALSRMRLGVAHEWLAYQWFVVARAAAP